MTQQELIQHLEHHTNIECSDDYESEQLCFRNTDLVWYGNNPERATAVKYWKIEQMGPDELMHEINRGLVVEGITRITGYFTKISNWNLGKLGELKKRQKFAI